MENKEKKEKDKWDKANVILKPVGGFLTALAVAGLGFFGSNYLENRQDAEMRIRLFTELVSEREQAESALRKDMFKSIIDTFLNPQTRAPSIEDKVLNLELLAYNFHESLNLKPIFNHLKKEIFDSKNPLKNDFMKRVEKVAKEITKKQKSVLEAAGDMSDARIDLKALSGSNRIILSDEFNLKVDNIERSFTMSVLKADPETREIRIRLKIRTPGEKEVEAQFWVGFFDFPMIDNTRLSHDQRCAIILDKFEQQNAEITILYFPGTHASLREKPYFQELIENLLAYKKNEK